VLYIWKPVISCFMLLKHWVLRAFSRACANTGNSIAAKMAIIAITTNNSISVKPFRLGYDLRQNIGYSPKAVL
jgi:hypothetical protein